MSCRAFTLAVTMALSGAAAGAVGAEIVGRVALPQERTAAVMNKRYEIVSRGGVIATSPPRAVVFIEGNFPVVGEPAVVQLPQKDLTFLPALLPVRVGTRVEFPNLDDTYHNIFSYSPPKRFDLGRYRPDERPIPSQVFDVPGLVTLRCDIHEHMRAVILVLDTPHFATTDEDGNYRLSGVPAGRYVVKAWLSSRETREHPVEVDARGAVRVDFP